MATHPETLNMEFLALIYSILSAPSLASRAWLGSQVLTTHSTTMCITTQKYKQVLQSSKQMMVLSTM
jgi:hypothetical protein